MKVLVTGGTGRLAKNFISTDKIDFLLPGRLELDLSNFYSIDKYLEDNKDIVGVILNGVEYLPAIEDIQNNFTNGLTLDGYDKLSNSLTNGIRINNLAPLQIISKLKDKLKFIIHLSTGLDPIIENKHILYRNSKASTFDLINRVVNTESYKDIKFIGIHPGHMHDSFTYLQSAKQLTKVVENLDRFEKGWIYGIFDKEKMEATKLEGFTYTQLATIEL